MTSSKLAGLGLACVVAVCPAAGMAAPAIDWQLEAKDGFRLFDKIGPEEAGRLDKLFAAMAASEGDDEKGPIRQTYAQIVETLVDNGQDPHKVELRTSNFKPGENDTPGTYQPGYLYPETYDVTIRLTSAPDLAGKRCQWISRSAVDESSVGQMSSGPWACDVAVQGVRVHAGWRNGRWGGASDITVVTTDGQFVASQTISFDDVLIVALGDSFISGEGNPDRPSRLDAEKLKQLGQGTLRIRDEQQRGRLVAAEEVFSGPSWPARIGADIATRAEWWDEPCHRSLLSWPVLTTLYAAAQDRHRAITLLHFGCSGAEGPEGVYGIQEHPPGSVVPEDASQIDQLSDLLRRRVKRRTIDKIFLSLGGNDAGFVKVITYAVLPPNGYGPLPDLTDDLLVWGLDGYLGDEGPIRPYAGYDEPPLGRFGRSRVPAETRLENLPAVYATTANYLQALPGYRDDQVFQAQYPDILRYGEDQFCRTSMTKVDLDALRPEVSARETAYREDVGSNDMRGGFEAMNGKLPSFLQNESGWNFQFKFDPDKTCNLQERKPKDSEVCKAFWVWSTLNDRVADNQGGWGWQIVSTQKTETTTHGWCVSPKDSLNLPIWNRRFGTWTTLPLHLLVASPVQFDPYREDLGRWFRTANDSALTQWAEPRLDSKGKPKAFFHNGMIHPTLNAHIAYAEAVYRMAFATDSDRH